MSDFPSGFDPDSDDWSQGGDDGLDDFANDRGWSTWGDAGASNVPYDPSDIRPSGYYSPQEAIYHGQEIGAGDFFWLIWLPSDGLWHLVIYYPEP